MTRDSAATSPIVAFDFDGVLSDSAREAFVVALRTYARLCPDSPIAEHAAHLPEADLDAYPFDEDPRFGVFVALMPLGNRAEDFGASLRAIGAGAQLADQDAYDTFFASLDNEWLERFHGEFYRARAALRDAHPVAWRALQRPYRPVLDAARRHAGDTRLAIATAKDATSVRLLLEAYGAADLFPSGRVLDKETGVSKRAHLERLAAELDAPFSLITFVDDKLNHLEAVRDLGVRRVLAGWGFNGERERAGARADGITVAALETVESDVFPATLS